jgi:hypothetical protein
MFKVDVQCRWKYSLCSLAVADGDLAIIPFAGCRDVPVSRIGAAVCNDMCRNAGDKTAEQPAAGTSAHQPPGKQVEDIRIHEETPGDYKVLSLCDCYVS